MAQERDTMRERNNRLFLLIYALVVVFCLCAVAYFSNQTFEQQDVRPYIERLTGLTGTIKALPRISFSYNENKTTDNRKNPVNFVHFFIRKGAHVLLYGILGVALVAMLSKIDRLRQWRWSIAIASVCAVATADEINQALMGGRTGMLEDILLDVSGFLLFALCIHILGKIRFFIVGRRSAASETAAK